jgi:serine/threonine protein kinase
VIESVSYLHENQVVHRNLKPGSFYLNSVDSAKDAFSSELVVGDYGVATVMRDARTKTRILHGAFDYAAPEVIDTQRFDFKSDVWAIGTILLDICTTSIYSVIKSAFF